jgi:predicted  nucleic acid-binding Zn-ribbon protein
MTASREELQAAVLEAQAALDKLREIEKLLETQLPAAHAVLQVAEKQLRAVTKPAKAAIRKAELETLKRKITEASHHAES